MTSIYDIPYEDIEKFLLANNETYKNEIDAYNKALILLNDKNAIDHSISIIEWLIAHNLLIKKINIPNFTVYQIDNMSQDEIDKLAKLLTMNGNNRSNIKNILKYLGKLDYLPEHPDIKPQILDKILELKILSSNLEEIIHIFKNNKFLRKFIYDNMEQIITNNDKGESPFFDNPDSIVYFILKLLKMKELFLVKKAIKICGIFERDYDGFPPVLRYLYDNITYDINYNMNDYLITEFSKLKKYINDIYGYPWID